MIGFRQGQNALTLDGQGDATYVPVPPPAYTSPGASVPATITGLVVTPTNQVDASWNQPTDGGASISSYEIRWSPAGAGTWTTIAGISRLAPSTVIASGLTVASLDFQVAARNSVGLGAWSTTVTATPNPVFSIETVVGLKALFRADQLTGLVNNDPVTTWSDESGLANHIAGSGATRPLYKTAQQNGLPGVQFVTATAQFLQRATLTGGTLAQPAVWIVAARFDANVTNQVLIDSANTSNRLAIRQISNNPSLFAGSTLSASVPSGLTAHVLEAHGNNTASLLVMDGTTVAGPGAGGAQSIIGITMGANGTPANYVTATIFEAALISPIPSAIVLNYIRSYLKAKWATP